MQRVGGGARAGLEVGRTTPRRQNRAGDDTKTADGRTNEGRKKSDP